MKSRCRTHDIFMDKVVTESRVYDGIGRKG